MNPPKYQSDETFTELIGKVINSEGGYVDSPNDPGGPTQYGVAYNYNVDYLKRFGICHPTQVKDLTLDQARQLYYEKYWVPSNAIGITDLALAYEHLDAAINCGVKQAATFLMNLSHNPKNYDGRNHANRAIFAPLFLEYTAQRLRFYSHCKNRKTFLEGWVNRMADVIQNASHME